MEDSRISFEKSASSEFVSSDVLKWQLTNGHFIKAGKDLAAVADEFFRKTLSALGDNIQRKAHVFFFANL